MKAMILAAAVLLSLSSRAAANGDAAFAQALNAGGLAVKAGAAQILGMAAVANEEQAFLDALNSRRPEDRVAALKGLKKFVAYSSRSRDAVIDHLGYYSEDASVRREAARSLSLATHDGRVKDALLKAAKEYNAPNAVRAMALKALYWQAQYDGNIRDYMRDLADRESNGEVRLAAIWGLMYSGGDSRVRDGLLDLAKRSYDPAVRVAALKSLFSQSRDSSVRDFVRDTAKRGSGELRYAAIMTLSERSDSSDTDLLADISKRDSDDQARQHALAALASDWGQVTRFFHVNLYTHRNGYSQLVVEAIDLE